MAALSRRELQRAIGFLAEAAATLGLQGLLRHVVEGLPALVGSELTTLSDCDLVADTRRVIGMPGGAISADERACFDRHLHEHPLVQYHEQHEHQRARRISDSLSRAQFHRTGLYNEYYRRIGIDHVVALPLITGRRRVVSFVLNRSRRDFSARDCEMLELLRPGLLALYRRAEWTDRTLDELDQWRARLQSGLAPARPAAALPPLPPLTARELQVLDWVRQGKSNRQIGAILGVSPRTVQKHLQHVFDKLGVDNRTAAAARLTAASSMQPFA